MNWVKAGGGHSSHRQAKEDVARLCVFRLEFDGSHPTGCSRPGQS